LRQGPRRQTEVLNDATLRAKKPGPTLKDLRDAQQPGLIFSILPSGRKQFSLRYRTQGKQRRLVLGDFPALTLSKARERAAAELVTIRAGHDRAIELRAAKARPSDSVEALARDYLAKHAATKRTGDEDERMLERDVLPQWGDRSVRGTRAATYAKYSTAS
jgi:hypothetical protein